MLGNPPAQHCTLQKNAEYLQPVAATPAERETEKLLQDHAREQASRARAMSSIIELRYTSRARNKQDHMRARRQQVSVGDFELLSVIGRGAFGEVRLCRERSSGSVYAMKTMRKSQLVGQGKVAHVWAERCAMAEAADGNPWVVQLHHAWCSAEHVYLVMDYLPGGDLMSCAHIARPPLLRACAVPSSVLPLSATQPRTCQEARGT